jgi:hypothetical protein
LTAKLHLHFPIIRKLELYNGGVWLAASLALIFLLDPNDLFVQRSPCSRDPSDPSPGTNDSTKAVMLAEEIFACIPGTTVSTFEWFDSQVDSLVMACQGIGSGEALQADITQILLSVNVQHNALRRMTIVDIACIFMLYRYFVIRDINPLCLSLLCPFMITPDTSILSIIQQTIE